MFLVLVAAPTAAFAGGGGKCNASACKVYTEGPPTAGGGGPAPTSTSGGAEPTVPIAKQSSRALAKAGSDKQALSNIISNPAYGATRGLTKSGADAVPAPSALGAAFDLGSGPTALLVILLATAVGLAAQGGIRSWHRKRSGS